VNSRDFTQSEVLAVNTSPVRHCVVALAGDERAIRTGEKMHDCRDFIG